MSLSSKSSQAKAESSNAKNDGVNQESHKITTFFSVLRPEGRAKMCASKTGDSKQKEILQKLKSKETMSLRPKAAEDGKNIEPTTKPTAKEKLRGNISVMSALKTPLSQVLRKSIEASESKKEQPEKTPSTEGKVKPQTGTKDPATSEKPVIRKSIQKAKKSLPESESRRALRHSQNISHLAKSFSSSLRSQSKKADESTPISGSSSRRRVTLSDSGESLPIKASLNKNSTQSSSSSPAVTTSPSPIEDGEHGTSNHSSASGGKLKKNRKRHFRGATYGLFLSKKKRRNMLKKSLDESRDDECSLAGTENSSYLDSDDGNSLMSEDLYTPSEKSLADEEHNPDSRNSPMLVPEQKVEINEATSMADNEDIAMENGKEIVNAEEEPKPVVRNPNDEVSQNATDMTQKIEDMQWEADAKDGASMKFPVQDLKVPQFDDISNESFSNSTSFPFESNENSEEKGKEPVPDIPTEKCDDEIMESDVVKEEELETLEESSTNEDKSFSNMFQNEENANPADGKSSPTLDFSEQEPCSEAHPVSAPTSGDENESHVDVLSSMENRDRDLNDAQSTIATCVKSRQRIKRRFTDDIVDTDVGLLTLNSSMAVPRKNPSKPDPPKDVIQTFQFVTHTEAKKGPIAKIECIYNSHQEAVKTCTCEGDTYEANLSQEEEGVFCQAVDSIDDKLVGCTNPVATPILVRPSVKVPFTIMCEMHLWRLKHHQSCPYCGLFCSQGYFVQCSKVKNNRKVVHLYHEQCQSKEEGITPFCFHCGTETGMKRVQLEMHMTSPPAFYLSQLPSLPLPHVGKARISFSDPEVLKKGDNELTNCTYRIEDTGKVLSSVGLKEGPEKEELDRLLQLMNEEKAVPISYAPQEFYNIAAEGDVMKVLNVLAQGVDPNLKFDEHEKETALHAAAAGGHTTVVHLLIQAGAINDVLNERIYTPLMLAVESNHKDVVFYLVKNGAIADFKGETGMSSFHIAAKNGGLEILRTLLSSRDVDINAQDDGGWTPIVWASEHDHYDVVKYLLKRGANPNIKDNEGNTGLHWSAFSGSVEICFLYLEYGCDINAVNERGDTPMHIAARQDSLSCVTLFLSRGADVQIKNKTDLIPAECVIDKNSDTYLSLSLNMLLKRIAGKYKHKAEKILHKDISRGKEQIAIPCVNDVDDEPPPLDFLYVTENCETTPMNIDRTITSLQSCHCEDDCSTAACTCASISYQCWYDKEGLLLPNFNLLDPPMLFECNRACSCWSLNCRNRVLQNGMTCRLQLIRTKGKGWGVRTLKDIPKGTFICEYVGEMISDSAADKRADDSYLFDLDNRDGETYCLDARYYGNISRFINHLCEPNLVPVKVYVDHQDLNFPRIAFFSSRDIKQYEELGFDYCEKFWVIKYKYFTCDCGSAKCKYSKDTIHNTLANYYRRVREEQMLEEATQQQTVPPDVQLVVQ